MITRPSPAKNGWNGMTTGSRVPLLARRTVGKGLAGTLLAGLAPTLARAADAYPNRSVTLIVPFAAGGSADVYGRLLAQQFNAATGQAFIVEDRPGAGSIIGTQVAATSRPDGYTLLVISNTHTVNETLFAKKPYKLMTSFEPIAPINSSDLVLVTRPTLGVTTLGEIIKMAKAKPGTLTFASSGPGTPYHMAGELFKQMAGIDIVHVPFKGSSEARIDVIGGQVDMMFDATTTMLGLIRSGKVTGIATTGTTRSTVLPNLPTMAESGVPGYETVIWLGLVAPKGTPTSIVDQLNKLITTIDQKPEVRAAWEKQGAEPVIMTPSQFSDFIAGDIKKWAKVVEISGARVNN
jgi:tripartite-type tricarboxylate transporter receptor subunit TctC